MFYDYRLSIWENVDIDLKTLLILAVVLNIVMVYEYLKDKDELKKQESATMLKRVIAVALILLVATLIFSVIRATLNK